MDSNGHSSGARDWTYCSAKELRAYLRDAKVDFSACVEKGELLALCWEAEQLQVAAGTSQLARGPPPSATPSTSRERAVVLPPPLEGFEILRHTVAIPSTGPTIATVEQAIVSIKEQGSQQQQLAVETAMVSWVEELVECGREEVVSALVSSPAVVQYLLEGLGARLRRTDFQALSRVCCHMELTARLVYSHPVRSLFYPAVHQCAKVFVDAARLDPSITHAVRPDEPVRDILRNTCLDVLAALMETAETYQQAVQTEGFVEELKAHYRKLRHAKEDQSWHHTFLLLVRLTHHPAEGEEIAGMVVEDVVTLVSCRPHAELRGEDISCKNSLKAVATLLTAPGCAAAKERLLQPAVVRRVQKLVKSRDKVVARNARAALRELSQAACKMKGWQTRVHSGTNNEEGSRPREEGVVNCVGGSGDEGKVQAVVSEMVLQLDSRRADFDIGVVPSIMRGLASMACTLPQMAQVLISSKALPAVLRATETLSCEDLSDVLPDGQATKLDVTSMGPCTMEVVTRTLHNLGLCSDAWLKLTGRPYDAVRLQRPELVSRLRKYLLHPVVGVRGAAALSLVRLGCILGGDAREDGAYWVELGRNPHQARLLAHVLDPTCSLPLVSSDVKAIPPEPPCDVLRAALEAEPLRVCDWCGAHNYFSSQANVKLSLCKGCKQRRYCSKECQKAHWKLHKQACGKPPPDNVTEDGTPAARFHVLLPEGAS